MDDSTITSVHWMDKKMKVLEAYLNDARGKLLRLFCKYLASQCSDINPELSPLEKVTRLLVAWRAVTQSESLASPSP